MKAIYVNEHGGPDVLRLSQVPPPATPGPGQVLVRVLAAGVNFMDVAQRRGSYPRGVPFIPGTEGAGLVEALGPGVSCVNVSDRVAFGGQRGAYAQLVLAEASQLIRLPDDLSFEDGAAFPVQGLTAQYMIHEFRQPRPGDFVLIHAAAGGVGGLLVQWARHLGAVVIATVSSEDKARHAQALGAEHVVIYTRQDFAAQTMQITGGRGASLILDSVGQSTCKGNLEAIAVRGSIVIFGASSGPPAPIDPYALMLRSVSICGGSLAQLRSRDELLHRADAVLTGIRAGWLKLSKSAVLPLEHAREAHQLLESRRSQGKLILTVDDH